MKAKQILAGIQDSTCRITLSDYLDLIEISIELGDCDFSGPEWIGISEAVRDKINSFDEELNNRVYH